MDPDSLNIIFESVTQSPFRKLEFYIATFIGLLGLIASYNAYRQAKLAKELAQDAGKTVKIQTIIIELTEIIQKLDRLEVDLSYTEARDLYNETNRKVRRLIGPIDDDEYKEKISEVESSLENIKESLEAVRPYKNAEEEAIDAVYHSVESPFSELSGNLAGLIGKFEKRTLDQN